MLEAYRRAGLVRLLELIRMPGRYQGVEHLNVLTNCLDAPDYDESEVRRELMRAHRVALEEGNLFRPNFSRPGQGFSEGLNPYTDWTLKQLEEPAEHAYLFLGVDWDTITSLGTPDEWRTFMSNPFFQSGKKVVDRYWHNVWAWIMAKTRTSPENKKRSWATPIEAEEAAAYIREDKGAFIFHNLIPYLRPAGEKKSGTKWYYEQWKDKAIQQNIIEDLKCLHECWDQRRLFVFCTSSYVCDALVRADYEPEMICCWKAHPSRVFHPGVILREDGTDRRFRGLQHFAKAA